jgi:cobyrinic acid a,c-diamide synthase
MMNGNNYPRIIISGLSGDSGKTIVSCGLIALFKNRGLNVTGFKKGPDYIDAAWLSLAAGRPARNLDSFMMGFPVIQESFLKNADKNGINIIEGNRGVFDGFNDKGIHSTAELAKILQSPVIIVQDISKVTRTAAALVLGCLKLDPELKIAGIILNKAAGDRHIKIVREAIEGETGIPVLGAIPKLSDKFILPSRHLGLIMPDEFERGTGVLKELKNVIEDNIDVAKMYSIIINTPKPEGIPGAHFESDSEIVKSRKTKDEVRIGYFKDNSFSFYYPENLEMLEEAGAELVPLSSSVKDDAAFLQNLVELDAIYIGGGFPEINLTDLSVNDEKFLALKKLVEEGLPVYAECGGLMYLANKVIWKEKEYNLAGILPVDIKMYSKPQGHGYTEAFVDRENPFFRKGVLIKGHEFHYSRIYNYSPEIKSSLSVIRGNGSIDKRDGLIYKNVFASYIHIHALATPEWVHGMIKCAKQFKLLKNSEILIGE